MCKNLIVEIDGNCPSKFSKWAEKTKTKKLGTRSTAVQKHAPNKSRSFQRLLRKSWFWQPSISNGNKFCEKRCFPGILFYGHSFLENNQNVSIVENNCFYLHQASRRCGSNFRQVDNA